MSHPEIIRMLSSCSHWIGEKLQDYTIEMTSSGYPRIWIPEDDDWYRLDAYIAYLEDEGEPSTELDDSSESNESSESSESSEDGEMEEEAEDEAMVNQIDAPPQFNFVPTVSVAPSDSFKIRTRYTDVFNVDYNDMVQQFVQRRRFIVVQFIITKWNRNPNPDGDLIGPKWREEKHWETLTFEEDVTINDLWEMVDERLMVLMNCAARERMTDFIDRFEVYSRTQRVYVTRCFEGYFPHNKVQAKVNLYSKLGDEAAVIFATRMYRERCPLTPLGDNPTLQSLKKKYRTFKWNKIVRNNQN